MAGARTNGTFFQARYKRLAVRRGEMKALVAVEHSMITAIWHMLSTNKPYHDLGHDHFDTINPDANAGVRSRNSPNSAMT